MLHETLSPKETGALCRAPLFFDLNSDEETAAGAAFYAELPAFEIGCRGRLLTHIRRLAVFS